MSIPFDLLGVEDVTKIMLFLLSVLSVMAGEVTCRGLMSWFNTHLREEVGPPVSPLSVPQQSIVPMFVPTMCRLTLHPTMSCGCLMTLV